MDGFDGDGSRVRRPGPGGSARAENSSRFRLWWMLVPVVVLVLCGGIGYVVVVRGASSGAGDTALSQLTTKPASPAVGIRLDKVSNGSGPGVEPGATMVLGAGGARLAGTTVGWGYLATCTTGSCGPTEQQDIIVKLDPDYRWSITARVGVLAGGPPGESLRFEALSYSYDAASTPDVLFDRTLAPGQSAPVSVEDTGDIRFVVSGPLGELTGVIGDPTGYQLGNPRG